MKPNYQALGEAIERAHDPRSCLINTCELSAALRDKLYLHAAYLCVRSSKWFLVEGDAEDIRAQFQAICPALGEDPAALEEANKFAAIPVVTCAYCDACVYLNRKAVPDRCDNCNHELAQSSQELPDLIILAIAEDVIQGEKRERNRK